MSYRMRIISMVSEPLKNNNKQSLNINLLSVSYSSCQYWSPHAAVTSPSHLLSPAVLHFLLLRSSGEPPLPLPPGQCRFTHQAVSQHERPVWGGGQAQEEEQTENQTPQRKHELFQRRYRERRGRGEECMEDLPVKCTCNIHFQGFCPMCCVSVSFW